MKVIEVQRNDHRQTRIFNEPDGVLEEGSIRLRIDRFAMTANNVSYAVYGDSIGYWNFFPSAPPWGRVPAMGWAEVIESNVSDLAVGTRFFGWYPMADTVDIKAVRSDNGFLDAGTHRDGHALIYRSFDDTATDPLHEPTDDGEDRQSLLRGLFLTSFLADEFLADPSASDEPYFGAENVVVLSASAKTAIGFAQRAASRGCRVTGVTSKRNEAFVATLPWYESVITYEDIGELDSGQPTICVDVAGDKVLLSTVHDHLGDQLRHSMLIGLSHHDAPQLPMDHAFAGPTPQFFNAPLEIERRRALWGAAEFDTRSAGALNAFVEGSRSWLNVDRPHDALAACDAWTSIYDGTASPSVGVVVTLRT